MWVRVMKERRTISVDELIRSFVRISYLQEQRIFKFKDIWQFIHNCYNCSYQEYHDGENYRKLIDDAEIVIEDMLNNGEISYVYPNGENGMYHIENKIDYMELTHCDKEYIKDMVKVFLCINGGNPTEVTLTPSRTNIKK